MDNFLNRIEREQATALTRIESEVSELKKLMPASVGARNHDQAIECLVQLQSVVNTALVIEQLLKLAKQNQ